MLSSTIVAEDGETNLSMAQRLITASGWRIRIKGDGTIHLCPEATEANVILDDTENDIVEPSVTDSQDLYSCPNVYMATSGDLTYTARDEESIQERGREIWMVENNVMLNAGESIMQYAVRMLEESKAAARNVQYQRRFKPDIVPGDIAELHFPGIKISGKFIIKKQKVTLGYAATVAEECVEKYRFGSEREIIEVLLIDDSGDYIVTDNNEILFGD